VKFCLSIHLLSQEIEMVTVIIAFISLIIVIWAMFVHFDKVRVHRHFHQNGNNVIAIWWRPIHHGWNTDVLHYGDGNRIYEVQYQDSTGTLHHVWCKTSMLNGVETDGDEITSPTMEADSRSAAKV
jgi:hypothetical protein